MIQVLQLSNQKDIKKLMRDIGVDPYGIGIMAPKAQAYSIKIGSVSNITANILKQEMLSLGADAAVARGALTGAVRKTDCLLMGNLSQLIALNRKLARQPFGLNKISEELSRVLKNFHRQNFILKLGKYKLDLTARVRIMGIVNIAPDSFSGDGISGVANVLGLARKMVKDGADIIDVGGESSRPGAKPVSIKEELNRTIPAIRAINKKINVPISIDTYKPEVARAALENGAVLVNDIRGLRDKKMTALIAKYKAAAVIMHMRGDPLDMQKNIRYNSLIDEIMRFLDLAIIRAQDAGIDKDKIIIDPGIGFGKTPEHNLEILRRLKELKALGKPILVGTSRKAFIGKILNAGVNERIFGTVSSCVVAAQNGARMVRVHDVKEVKQALRINEAICGNQYLK